jgi:hypothetical protein
MKKITSKKILRPLISTALFVCALPFSAHAQVPGTTFLANKICLVKYQAEVTAVSKLIDNKKADAKLLEIKTVRKEEDKNIKDIFNKIDEKIEDADKKETVDEKKELILKVIADRREKTDELQTNIRISKSEIEQLVKATLVEVSLGGDSKTCPVRTDTAKDIRTKNIQKLKKLASDKKETYQKQTKEIQEGFNLELRSALIELSGEISR